MTNNDTSHNYTHTYGIAFPKTGKSMQCYVCKKETKQLIPIYEFNDVYIGFNYKILFHCKSCFMKAIMKND